MQTKESNNTAVPAEMTLATFQAEHPDLYAEVFRAGQAAGEKAILERLDAISKLAPDDPAFVVEQFAKGASLDQAKDVLIAKLTEALAKKPAQAKPKTDLAVLEFAGEQEARRAGTSANEKDAAPDGAAAK
jgi:hypothetical protein